MNNLWCVISSSEFCCQDLPGDTQQLTAYEQYFPELLATFTGNFLADFVLYPLETVVYRLYIQVDNCSVAHTVFSKETVQYMLKLYICLHQCWVNFTSSYCFIINIFMDCFLFFCINFYFYYLHLHKLKNN